jgi:polar amino acid transport system substrate-binding protein
MRTKKLWLAILAVALAILTAFAAAGCSSPQDKKPSAGQPAAEDSLAKIKAKGKLVVGMNAEFAPFEFHTMINGKDTIAGFDMDLAKEIAKDMGVQLEVKELAFDALLATLQSGQIDIIISGMSATEERRKSVDFSEVYYRATQSLLTTKENVGKFNSFADVKNYKIGLQLSSLQDKLMTALIPDGKFTRIESMTTLFLSLKSKQIDGIVTAKVVCQMAIAANPEFVIAEKVTIDDSSLKSPGVAVALRKGSTSLKAQIDGTVKRLNQSGQMQRYVDEASKLAGSMQPKK